MTADVLVIGIGNEFRRDDGVGLAVAAAIADRRSPGVSVMTATGEPTAILDAWAGVALAVVIDAAAGERSIPGTIRRWAPGDHAESAVVSSHAFGLPETFALGRAVGRIPQSLVVFTVDIEKTGHGVGLSPAVTGAVPAVVDAILAEIEAR